MVMDDTSNNYKAIPVKRCLTWYSSPFPLPFLGFSKYYKFRYFIFQEVVPEERSSPVLKYL